MVVEDDPDLRHLVSEVLTRSGYDVRVAEDGLQALMQIDADNHELDLLIVDIMMPQLDGLSLVRALKGRAETRRIPVIFVTAKSDPGSIAQGVNVGAKFYITKPFTLDALLAKVRRALGEP